MLISLTSGLIASRVLKAWSQIANAFDELFISVSCRGMLWAARKCWGHRVVIFLGSVSQYTVGSQIFPT